MRSGEYGGPRARMLVGAIFAAMLAACSSLPKPVMPADENDPETFAIPDPAPAVDTPPVEAPLPEPPATAPSANLPARVAVASPATPPAPVIIVTPPASSPSPPTEDEQMIALLADLQRFGAMPPDELKHELTTATQTFAKQRTDASRVRLAVLYTLVRSSPADDQRALQLFENVARNAPATSSIRHLAAVLQAQVTERQRAVHDEQEKADAAIQKLEALRAMERSLLRDRVRSGGGGGSAGAGGSGR
ncbi:MAG TPA: hypothetical protein VKV24_06980 [Casimicrobiaceae bacterium]|nr:hypothetical protein [Casimicrobiaceae bacterium]